MQKSFLYLFIFISQYTYCQNKDSIKTEPIFFFKNIKDFFDNRHSQVLGKPSFIEKNDTFIQLETVLDIQTENKLKHWRKYWGIEYKGIKYFHLGYLDEAAISGTYMKFDIIGKYSAIFLNEQSLRYIWNYRVYYGGGLQGVLLSESLVWGTNWIDKNNKKNRIIIVDTTNINIEHNGFSNYYTGFYLHGNQLKQMIKGKFPDIKIKDLSFERVVELIIELNKKREDFHRNSSNF